MEDCISNLPEEILRTILSLLTLREAAQTSVISRRWRNLWKFVDNLNFDGVNNRRFRQFMPYSIRSEEGFPEWVDHVMDLYQGSSLRQLKIDYPFGLEFPHHIDNWIAFAIAKKVIHLEVHFSFMDLYDYNGSQDMVPSIDSADIFPCFNVKQASTSIQHVSLTACRLNPSSLDQFKSLRSFSLVTGYLTDELLEHFLSNCLSLENLSVCWSKYLVNPKIVGSCLQLKFLEICNCFSLKSLEIYAPDLKSLKYHGKKISINLISTPKLLDLTVTFPESWNDNVGYALSLIESNFSSLETMVLHISPDEVQVTSFPTLSNLKELVLSISELKNIFLITSLLRASPSLRRLELQTVPKELEIEEIEIDESGILECPHNCLKEVEVVGFCGFKTEIELLIYVVRNAIALEKVTLDPYELFQDFALRGKVFTAARDRARQFCKKFCNQVNPSVNVVII